jgi:hypothetical protein
MPFLVLPGCFLWAHCLSRQNGVAQEEELSKTLAGNEATAGARAIAVG